MRLLVMAISFSLFVAGAVRSAEPIGYFTDVHPIRGIDRGAWKDHMGSISADGLELYFASNYDLLPGEDTTLFVAHRESVDDRFGPRRRLPFALSDDWRPVISPDGLTLTFNREIDGTQNAYITTRDSTDAEWKTPTLFPEIVGATEVLSPVMSVDRLSVIYRDLNDEFGDSDLHVASRTNTDESFVRRGPLQGINRRRRQDSGPSLSLDGNTLFFSNSNIDFSSPALYVSQRNPESQTFEDRTIIDSFALGAADLGRHEDAERVNVRIANWGAFVTPDWPADGSKIYFSATDTGSDYNLHEATWRHAMPKVGDLTNDSTLDIEDMELLEAAIKYGVHAAGFDFTDDGLATMDDRQTWVTEVRGTWLGDSNLDGRFNTSDFVHVFQANQYEDAIEGNSTWSTGDWNGDGDFDSTDFIVAFADAGFEKGRRARAFAVPEPSFADFGFICSVALFLRSRFRKKR